MDFREQKNRLEEASGRSWTGRSPASLQRLHLAGFAAWDLVQTTGFFDVFFARHRCLTIDLRQVDPFK